jgi:hypothetical protein
VLAIVPRFAVLNLPESVGLLRAIKIRSTPSFREEGLQPKVVRFCGV